MGYLPTSRRCARSPRRRETLRAHATPTNLVAQLTRFIGRERELQETKGLLVNARLLTISGAGGLGKTRLSIELATSVSEVFSAGVWFVELAGLSDESLVPQAVATVVGVRESTNEPMEVTLSRHLGTLRALIVLDNCEHLVEGCARMVQALLQRCPVLTVLATSREILNVPGEVVSRLSPLALPSAERLDAVEELLRSEAVALFVDRATLADPSFRLDPQSAVRGRSDLLPTRRYPSCAGAGSRTYLRHVAGGSRLEARGSVPRAA